MIFISEEIINQIKTNKDIYNEFIVYNIDIFYIIELFNNIKYIEYDILLYYYTKIQSMIYINIQYIELKLLNEMLNGIINRIIYEMLYCDINDNCIYICDKIIKLYYTKENPDIYDYRLKCFMEQIYNHYIIYNESYNEYNINSILNLTNININQSLHYNNYINLPLYIQCDIINLYNHFFDHYDKFCDKMDIFELSNYIGSYFYYTNCITNLTLFILTNTNCKFLFDKINQLLSNIIFNNYNDTHNNTHTNILLKFVELCHNNEICNSDSFIFYINYIQIIYEAYISNNINVIINNYNKLYTNSEKYYFHYLSKYERRCGLFYLEYILIKSFKKNNLDILNLNISDTQYLPKYIFKILE
jgi:hypothetical protein